MTKPEEKLERALAKARREYKEALTRYAAVTPSATERQAIEDRYNAAVTAAYDTFNAEGAS